jgi:integrase
VQCLNEAVQHGLVVRNVARLQRPPKVEHEPVEIIPADAIGPMLEKLGGHAFYPLVVTSLYTGLRRGEQLALTWADVDLDAKVLRVERALDEVLAGVTVKAPKTKAGRRTITLPDVVVDVLRDLRREQMERGLFLRAGRLPADAPVFPNHDGGYRVPHNFSTTWLRLVRRLGLPKVSWHALRHTHASILISVGVDIATIASRLGHENVATTLSTYTHLFAADDRAAADAINAMSMR